MWRNLSCGVKRRGFLLLTKARLWRRLDDPATTAPEAFRFDICGSVSEAIPDNRYGVSNGELTGGRYAVARHVGELDDISHTIWGIIRHWLPASGEKMRKAPILFHYTNLAEGVTEQRLETDVYVPLA